MTIPITIINNRPKPLALYIFSRNKDIQQRILQATASGGVCINDTIMQVGVNDCGNANPSQIDT